MPIFDDEATLTVAIESALGQSLSAIELICVDDASTDGSVAVVERFAARDPRVRLVRQMRNQSAFQARRAGIRAARAEYVLFLDGDDELTPDAARSAFEAGRTTEADLVGFGVEVIEKDGRTGGAYERRLQPRHGRLDGAAVLDGLFPIGKPAQGQLWRFMFRTQVLREAYALLPDDLVLPRVNDLPLLFLVAAIAQRHVSIEDKLYRYHFGRGGSGQVIDSIDRAEFYVSAVRSIDAIRPAVEHLVDSRGDAAITEAYESARLSIIGYVCSQIIGMSQPAVLDAALSHLDDVVPGDDVIIAAARFYPRTLKTLRHHVPVRALGPGPVDSVLLVTSTLRMGGVSAVLAAQADHLRAAGYRVTVVARSGGSDPHAVPDGVDFIELAGKDLAARLVQWDDICHTRDVDVVIDHQILYTDQWPEYALVARAAGASTIGWLHNFVGRPVYDGNRRLTLIEECAGTLAQLITLSPLDVAYFRLRGIRHVAHVPNPPSPLLAAPLAQPRPSPRHGRIELVWWGRLEERTKQVSELIELGVQLRKLGADFRLTAIGPDWGTTSVKGFNDAARRRRVGDQVIAIGPRRGDELRRAIDAADAFVSTSIIEGYQLTIAEAQARALPVFMYELPWLPLVQGNEGIVAAPQGGARALAHEIVDVFADTARFARLSAASVDAAERARDHDFATLYRQVVTGSLPVENSPEPTVEDAGALLGLMVFFAERAAARRAHRRGDAEGSGAARLWAAAAPAGRAALTRLPGLRPMAHRIKEWLRLS